jgi:hypothetical protein
MRFSAAERQLKIKNYLYGKEAAQSHQTDVIYLVYAGRFYSSVSASKLDK